MNRALLLVAAPATAAIALWGGAVLGYPAGITLAALFAAGAMLAFLLYRRRGRAAGS